MEIKVEGLDNSFPAKCYIGIRSGGVQKQAPYDPKTLYRFSEAKRNGKIDIYQRIGTCEIAWNLEDQETRVCKALDANKGDTGMRMKVSMNRIDLKAKTTAVDTKLDAKPPAKAPPKNVKADAAAKSAKYLSERRVEEMLTTAMRALLKDLPDDAAGFLCDFIDTSYGSGKRAAGSQAMSGAAAKAPAKVDVMALRADVGKLLMSANADGTLLSTLADMKKEDVKPAAKVDVMALRADVGKLLMSANADGTLLSTLADMKKEDVKPAAKVDVLALRAGVGKLLMAASADGTLHSSLAEIQKDDGKAAAKDNAEELELKLAATKIQAVHRGKTARRKSSEEAFGAESAQLKDARMLTPKAEEVRLALGQALIMANRNGSLARMLGEEAAVPAQAAPAPLQSSPHASQASQVTQKDVVVQGLANAAMNCPCLPVAAGLASAAAAVADGGATPAVASGLAAAATASAKAGSPAAIGFLQAATDVAVAAAKANQEVVIVQGLTDAARNCTSLPVAAGLALAAAAVADRGATPAVASGLAAAATAAARFASPAAVGLVRAATDVAVAVVKAR